MILFCIMQSMEADFSNNRIKELRQEKGLSQRELAAKTNIKQANISRWEAGIVMPNVLDVWILANYFNVSVDYLIGRKEY